MGIRYYAYPVDANELELARISPATYLSEDPFADAWFTPLDERPPMLYLDKCWRELQALLELQEPLQPRPAYGLVRGNVTMTGEGWIPFVRLVEPDEVAEIADDLTLVEPAHVTEMLTARTASFYPGETIETAEQYIVPYLRDAQKFTRELAGRGDAFVYKIG